MKRPEREERYTVLKPVYETEYREETIQRTHYVTETQMREERRTVMKPVLETSTREERRTVMRPVTETQLSRRMLHADAPGHDHDALSVSTRAATSIRRATNLVPCRTDCAGCLAPRTRTPTRGLIRRSAVACIGCPSNGPGVYSVQRVYVPNYVTQVIPQTTYVPETVARKVPVEVTRYEPVEEVRQVPVSAYRMEQEEQRRLVPVTVQRPVVENVVRKVPVQKVRWEQQEVVRKVPVTSLRYVEEQRTEEVPVKVQKWVAEQRTEQVRRQVSRWVAEETVQRVPRTVVLRVPIDDGVSTVIQTVPSRVRSRRSGSPVWLRPDPRLIRSGRILRSQALRVRPRLDFTLPNSMPAGVAGSRCGVRPRLDSLQPLEQTARQRRSEQDRPIAPSCEAGRATPRIVL